jgi:alkylmercury lyase-like protein
LSDPGLAQQVRFRVYQQFLDTARPPLVEELMAENAMTRAEIEATLQELVQSRGTAVVKGTYRILMAWPFSAIATPFKVKARGMTYFANCSWDAIAFHSMLGDDAIEVDSFCHHCARHVHIELAEGQATVVEPASTIVYLALRPTEWWEDIITTCSNTMVFFCSAEHRDASGLKAPADQAASLTPQQTHELGVPLYKDRLKLEYVRPGRDELNAHFESLGLTGPYWRI